MPLEDLEDHDLLIRIDGRLKNVEKLIANTQVQCDTRVTKINKDLDSLKTWKNRVVGAIGILSLLTSFIIVVCIEYIKLLSGVH